MSSLERYLDRLAEEARRSLPPHKVAALLAEARAHLEDDVQARLELGASLEEAEQEAVRAFGSVQSIGAEVQRRGPRAELAFLLGATGLAIFFGTLTNVSMNLAFGLLSILTFSALFAAILWGSSHARRPQVFALAALFVATLGTSSFVASFTIRTTSDTRVPYRRSQLPGELAVTTGRRIGDERALVRFQEDVRRFATGESTSASGIVARPNDPQFNRWAQAALSNRFVRTAKALDAERREERELTEAIARPWWRQLPYAPASVFQEIWPSFVGLGAMHLFIWGFGQAWRADRRRRPHPPRSAS